MKKIKNILKSIFKYIEPLWTGNDGKISVRSSLAIAFSINLMVSIHKVVDILYEGIKMLKAGKSLPADTLTALNGGIGQTTIIISAQGVVILTLLGLKAYQSMKEQKVEETTIQQPPIENSHE
jgi:hypothetical protein